MTSFSMTRLPPRPFRTFNPRASRYNRYSRKFSRRARAPRNGCHPRRGRSPAQHWSHFQSESASLSRSEQLLLPAQIHAAMIQHAQSELPNECCGVLAGVREEDVLRVLKCYPLVNEAASPTEYLSEPKSMFAADKDMRQLGYDIV